METQVDKKIILKRMLVTTAIFTVIAAVLGWRINGNILWMLAIIYGGAISILNFWLLYIFIIRLLTSSQGFDYKTLLILGSKFIILFGGLAAGYFILKLPILPLMIGFFSFLAGIFIEVIFWAISASQKGL